MPDDGQTEELQRAAVLFPRLVLWLIGAGMVALTSLGGVVLAQQRTAAEEQKQKVEKHAEQMSNHESRLRLLEQSSVDLKETAKETRTDVKEIRKLLEERNPRRGER